MAKEYIEREAVFDHLTFCRMEDPETKVQRITGVVRTKDILAIPAADVVEVKHGRWVVTKEYNEIIEMEVAKWTCSVCNEYRLSASGLNQATNYCPSCGAKMDGGADHERL